MINKTALIFNIFFLALLLMLINLYKMEKSKEYLEDIYNNIKDVIKETKDKSEVSLVLFNMASEL